MRIASLASVVAAGALLVACSKPEPSAGGAPTPEAVTVDSANASADSMANDSMKAAMSDSVTIMTDSAVVADSTKTN